MIFAYIGAFLVTLILILFSACAVLWITSNVSRSIKSKTLELMSSYDQAIERKSKQLNSIQTEELQSNDTPAVVVPETAAESLKQTNSVPMADVVSNLTSAEYVDRSIGDVYQKIQGDFQFSPEDAFSKIPESVNDKKTKVASDLLKEISFDNVFELSTLPAERQLSLLEECLSAEEKDLLKEYCNDHEEFSIVDFYETLKRIASETSQVTVMRVAPNSRLTSPNKNVKIIEDDGICEGFQLESGNTAYDYSIKKREIS